MGKHITGKLARGIEPLAEKAKRRQDTIPGPSTNAATNLVIADIFLRGTGRILRNSIHKGVLRTTLDPDKARDIIRNRSMVTSLALYGMSKMATRSVPGAALIGGGLLVKTLFDRSQSRRKSRREGRKQLNKMAAPD